jgi:hypothetical protein
MLDWRLSFARREMTGIALTSRGVVEAERDRRIV